METLIIHLRRYKENKVARNSFYSSIQFVVPTLLLLGMTPVFVHKMGTENYGLWMLATSALGLMGIAEFGLNTAISKYIAEFVGSGDAKALSIVVSGGSVAYILLGFGLIIPVYLLSPVLAGIFKPSEAISVEQIAIVIRIMSLGFIPLLLRSGALAVPIGLQQFEIPVIVTIGYQVMSYSAALIVTISGGSVAQVVKSTVVVLWITALGSSFIAWQMLKPFKMKFSISSSDGVLRGLFSFSLMSGISSIGSQVFSFGDRLAVGVVLGLEAVAYYTVIISVANKILQLNGALTSALMPAVSGWMASGAIRRAREYFLKTTAAILVLNLLVAGVLIFLSSPLLQLWMGDTFAIQVFMPFRFLIIIYALISLNAPAYHVANGIGAPWLNALGSLIGGISTIGLILWLGRIYGLLGVAIANSGYLFNFVLIIFMIFYFQIHGTDER